MKIKDNNVSIMKILIALTIIVCGMTIATCSVKIDELQLQLAVAQAQCKTESESAATWEAAYNELQAEVEQERLAAQEEETEEVEALDTIEESMVEASAPSADSAVLDEWGYDFGYVVRVVGAEARGEPFEGIMAVAQCIRTTAERTGQTPEQIVKIPGQYASPVSENCTDNMETVNEACLLVFGQGENAVDDTIEYFCSTSTNSAFHNGLRYVCTIGHHNFYASH